MFNIRWRVGDKKRKMKRALFLLIMTSFVVTVNAQVTKTLKTERDGFQWYELKENGAEGALDVNGQSLIPLTKGYDRVYYHNGYFNVKKNRYVGLYSAEGKEIISTERGYEYVSYFNGYINIQDQFRGICNMEGKEIIPTSRGYDWIVPQGKPNDYPYFQVWKSDNTGVCDIDGNEIIPPNEDYSSKCYYIKELNAFGCCEKHASTGVKIDQQGHAINYLDKDGNEVIDFLFQSYWDFQYEKGVMPDEKDVLCSQFIIRFEFKPSSFIVRVIVADRATGTETVKESHYISPSNCLLQTKDNDILIGFDVQGTTINKNLIVLYDGKIDLVYDLGKNKKYHRYRNIELLSSYRSVDIVAVLVGCPNYRDEINFKNKFLRLKEKLTSYSWKERRY